MLRFTVLLCFPRQLCPWLWFPAEDCNRARMCNSSARLKEIGTRWNQRCLIFQCVPIFFKGRSFTSVSIFVPSWYALICIVKCNISSVKFNFDKWLGCGLGRGLPSIMKFKNTCILTESKTFYPHKNCRTYLNKMILARQWRHSLRNNHHGPLYFLLVPVSFRCPYSFS